MNDVKSCRSCGLPLLEGSEYSRCDRCVIAEQLLLSHVSASSSPTPQGSTEPVEEMGTEFGDYVLLNEIARGGMGYVYRARQKGLNRIVALKRPLPGIAADADRVRRFRTEAEAVAALSHPNIIPVFESGEWNGEQFFAMAYIEGQSLSELVHQRPIPSSQAARYVEKIAQAIHHAHQRGVLHRDLKPANIIIDPADEPRIADFGIAQLLRHDDPRPEAAAGTAHYMAPEQIRPGTKQLSVATDVYALGGILYQLLTRRPPFEGETRDEVFWAAYYEEPVAPSRLEASVPRDLEAICLKALEKDPEQRYASAQAMAEDLERFRLHRPVLARPVGLLDRLRLWVKRNPVIAGMLLLLTGAVVTGLAGQLMALQKIRLARAASEGFIGFMNQELAHDLHEVGRLDLMEKVNARAEDYYTNYPALGDTGYSERKARFYENAASVEMDLGQMSLAEARAAQAEGIYHEQESKEPRNFRWKRAQARVRTLRLNIAKHSEQKLIAQAHGAAALAFALAAVELAPTDPTNRAELANVLLEQASFWIHRKVTETASSNIAKSDAILREVVRSPAVDPEWAQWLANCAYYRGLVRKLRSDPGGALTEFSEYLRLVQALVESIPQNSRKQFELAVAHSRVGEALIDLKEFDEASAHFGAFETFARNLTQIDPRNTAWRSLLGQSLAWKGYLARARAPGETTTRDLLEAALAIQSNLVAINPDWDRWLQEAGRTSSELARWYEEQSLTAQARSLTVQWRQQCQSRALQRPHHPEHQDRWGKAIVAEAEFIGRTEGRGPELAFLQRSLAEFPADRRREPGVLAKARVLAKLAALFDKDGDPGRAAASLCQALELRRNFLEQSPLISELRQQIPNNFLYASVYRVKAGEVDQATGLAEEGLNWASSHLLPEEARAEYAQMCSKLTQAVSAHKTLTPKVKRIVERCLAERLAAPPALSAEEERHATRLRQWLDQHP